MTGHPGSFFKLRADMRRLSSTASTPLIQTYNDAISAIVVIRAFGAAAPVESAFKRFMDLQRKNFVADFYGMFTTLGRRWQRADP